MNSMRIFCGNNDCKYYWEDWCQRDMEDMKVIHINNSGKCDDFEQGECQYYKDERECIMKENSNKFKQHIMNKFCKVS